MTQGIVTKTGNSYAIRVPKSYITSNQLKLGDKVPLQDTLNAQQKALERLVTRAHTHGKIKQIEDLVAWQREQRISDDPWDAI